MAPGKSKMALKIIKTIRKNNIFAVGLYLGSKQPDVAHDGPEMARYGPITAQVAPKVAQDDPKMAPRCVKMGSSWPPIALRFLVSHCEIYLKTFKKPSICPCNGEHTLGTLNIFWLLDRVSAQEA